MGGRIKIGISISAGKIAVILTFLVWAGCADKNPGYSGNKPDRSYNIDSIPMPQGLSGEVGALAFLPSGKLIAAFRRGEVMTYDPANHEWAVFARGLHLPLGLLVRSESEVLVMQYPELTRLVDTDGNGEADVYENVTDDFGLGGNYHEFTYGPVEDASGNLYIALNSTSNGGVMMDELRGILNEDGLTEKGLYSAVPYRGWIMRLTPDAVLEPFASGFRSPNGLEMDDLGRLWVTDNQGDWVGTSPLFHVEYDQFYGHPPSLAWSEGWPGGRPTDYGVAYLDSIRRRPAVLFPHNIMANSPTEPVTIPEDVFGPFGGQLLVGEMNQERIVRVMVEEVGGQWQGACIPFIDGLGLRKGNNRLVFDKYGALWVGQNTSGWAGSSGIQRIEFTGRKPVDIQSVSLMADGFRLTFTAEMQEEPLQNPENYAIRSYFYNYHEKYGSDQMDIKTIEMDNISISQQGSVVDLMISNIENDRVYEFQIQGLESVAGDTLVNGLVCYTVNELRHFE